MASLPALSAIARRRAAPAVVQHTQKRGMALGGSKGPPPDWQGVDKVVRGYFPEDYKLSMAILGGYVGLGVLYKIKSSVGGKPAPAEVSGASSGASSPGIPGIESPEFEKFVETDAFVKLLENEAQLAKLLEAE